MNDDELVEEVERVLEGRPIRVRIGIWVKDKKNRVGKVVSVHETKAGVKWAVVLFGSRHSSVWLKDLRRT